MLVYLSHAVGGTNGGKNEQRGDNLASSGEWLRWLTYHTRWSFIAPWFAHVVHRSDVEFYYRNIDDQLRALSRCDALVVVGPKVSDIMLRKIAFATRSKIAVCDLTILGPYAPRDMDEKEASLQLDLRMKQALAIAASAEEGVPE